MANYIVQQKKTKRNLIFMFGFGIIAIIAAAYLGGFLKGTEEIPLGTEGVILRPEININAEILDSQLVKDLISFSKIDPLEDEDFKGRENPFIPY
ncbi:MAG: hypothetical protein ABH831_01850 [Candidatus Nealsonbacteria bacterium]